MKTCDFDGCEQEADWAVYAAYDVGSSEPPVHPLVARYPAAMLTACGKHLPPLMALDECKAGSTQQWVVKPL